MMQSYNSALNQPCGDFPGGEAEDYTVFITGGTAPSTAMAATLNSSSLLVMPNPIISSSATAILNMAKEGNASLRIIDLSGRTLYKKNVTNLQVGKNSLALNDLARLSNGVYIVEARQDGIVYRTNAGCG
jgi:hypothetical protein